MGRPIMFMLAGPNGAGKSTLYETILKPRLSADVPFINADQIQRAELQDQTMAAAYQAAEIAEARRREHLAAARSFVSESTFSHESKLSLIRDARAAGFLVVMYHVNVRDADLSVLRVANRVDKGGHPVPEEKIRERYVRNQAIIRQGAVEADRAFVYDNSGLGRKPELAIELKRGKLAYASDRVPAWARKLYAKELEVVAPSRLNPGAASFDDAKAIAQRIAGPQASTRIGGFSDERSTGEIVGESSDHWLQQSGEKTFVVHLKRAVSGEVRLHRRYAITYAVNGRGIAEESRLPPDTPHPRA
jgi:predicted ABC-type ATPase